MIVHPPTETAIRPDYWNETVAEPNRKTIKRNSDPSEAKATEWVVVDLEDESDDDSYGLLQKFEGVVLARNENEFTTRLIDTFGNLPNHQATFLLEELADAEKELVETGAPFVWTIGYRVTGGTKRRESSIYFRRLPFWSQSEIDAAKSRVKSRQIAVH